MCRRCPNAREFLLIYKLKRVDLGDLGEVRRLLGEASDALTDEQVARIRDLSVAFAEAAFDWWRRRRVAGRNGNVSHNPSEDGPSSPP